jgi:hypothetical protein
MEVLRKGGKNMESRIIELGRQLGLSLEEIHSLMDDMVQDSEQLKISLGPPNYPGTHYGTISVDAFADEHGGPDGIKPVSLSLGPPRYTGSFYGTVSINDFRP